jgi:hypothetical protein
LHVKAKVLNESVSVHMLTGCAIGQERFVVDTNADLRRAENAPDHFVRGSHTDDSLSEPSPGMGCHNPMVDPRNDTRLILQRSAGGLGYYEVATGVYGVHEKELLRLNCNTGKTLGIVRR